MRKKTVSLVLIFALFAALLVSFSSCSSPYTDEQAREILAEVLEKDVELNKIIWGEGLSTEKDPGGHEDDSTFYYMEVSIDSKYKSLDELKAAVDETYAENLREIVYEHAFGSDDEAEESETVPRYSQSTSGFLQIDVTEPGFELKNVAYIEDATVSRGTKKSIEIDIKVSSDGGETFRDKTLVLRLEDGVWKLDTQSWCVDFVY